MAKLFTIQQQEILRENPYTMSISEQQIRFTGEAKRFLLSETAKPGVSIQQAFSMLGYDPDMLGYSRMSNVIYHAKKTAASPKGIRDSNSAREKKLYDDQSRKRTQTEINDLREEVIKLHQEVAFLKKIVQLYREDNQAR